MRLLTVALAAWRAATFLSDEPGPYRISERLREAYPDKQAAILTGAGYREVTPIDSPDEAVLIELPGHAAEFGRLMRCPYCSSVWLAAGFAWLDAHGGGWIVDIAGAAGLTQVSVVEPSARSVAPASRVTL